jgi:crotonobetainyl-CoA:carnitine CoA-transferase CaiB-like acyl-CoA transferase
MTRFGPPGVPNFHGVASCVDYLTGYMATWAGLSALYSRELSGTDQGDWATTSLATCASLTQLTLQLNEPPASAVGCHATGMTSHNRVFRVQNSKYVYGQAPKSCDVSALILKLADMDQAQAVNYFKQELQALAVPVNTVKEMAAKSADGSSKSANFKKKTQGQGWDVETWEPTWLCFDGEPLECVGAPFNAGSNAQEVLGDLGYSSGDILAMQQSRAVIPTNWHKWAASETLQKGPEIEEL